MVVNYMTITELSQVLKVHRSSVRRAVKKWFPKILKNGIKTRLNEVEVTIVQKELEKHHNHKNKSLNNSSFESTRRIIGEMAHGHN